MAIPRCSFFSILFYSSVYYGYDCFYISFVICILVYQVCCYRRNGILFCAGPRCNWSFFFLAAGTDRRLQMHCCLIVCILVVLSPAVVGV